jgi:hypothetical protein
MLQLKPIVEKVIQFEENDLKKLEWVNIII